MSGRGTAAGTVHRQVRAVVLDIEGTVGSLAHVRDTLFPYARQRLAWQVESLRGTPGHAALLREVCGLAGLPDLDEASVVRALLVWSDDDVKARPLKALQAEIWAEGYADGTLKGHVFDDVPGALERWHTAGIGCHIYSSGAAAAQHDWFAHSNHGDLTGRIRGYFDLVNGGDKRQSQSYCGIADALGVPPGDIVYLSDSFAELEAATLAGWQAVGTRRPGDPRGAAVPGHPTVASLDEVVLTATGHA